MEEIQGGIELSKGMVRVDASSVRAKKVAIGRGDAGFGSIIRSTLYSKGSRLY